MGQKVGPACNGAAIDGVSMTDKERRFKGDIAGIIIGTPAETIRPKRERKSHVEWRLRIKAIQVQTLFPSNKHEQIKLSPSASEAAVVRLVY